MWRETIHIPVPWLPLLLAGSALTGLCLFVAPHGAVLIAVLLLALAWMLFAMQRPLVAFTIVLGVFVLAYARMGLNVFAADGAGGRGAIYFGDLLWLGFAIAWCARRALLNPARRVSPSVPPVVYLLLPYLLLASCLPIFGVMAAGWPVSNAIPGLRQLLWASFAYFAYQFALEYGAARVLRALLGVTVLAGVLHLLYGLLQLGFNLGVLPRSWVALDDLYMLQNQTVLFFYPRLTGLLVNPNSYGLFGAFLFLWAVSLALAKALAGRRILWGVAMACALFALVFSASRSALLGLMVAAVIVGVGALKVPKLARRGMQFIVPMVLLGGVLLIGSWSFLPANIQARFGNFSQVLNQGVQADQGASERVQMWRELWQRYLTECPWGTWVP
ncbi:MAG TPA: O-antigen ligase family protein, partial [Armatimonadota bacterium]